MSINVYKINNQFTVVNDKGIYIGSIVSIIDDTLGQYYKGDYLDIIKNRVLCTFANEDLMNVVIALSQYHQIIISEVDVKIIN